MNKREDAIGLIKLTMAFDEDMREIIRKAWNIDRIKESLDMLVEEYQKLKETYEDPYNKSYDLNMIELLSRKLVAIERLRWKLDDAMTQFFPTELKKDFVLTIIDYYRFIQEYIKENKEVKA